ncbi:MAG: hypothetical protein ACKPEA_09210, partial [Planctomycetota bacterium]
KLQKLAKRRLVAARVVDRIWAIFLTAGLDEMFETSSDVGTALASIQLGSAEPCAASGVSRPRRASS